MPDTVHSGSVRGEFADVLCADSVWVRAEFEAIVAANFELPPGLVRTRLGSSGPGTARHHPLAAVLRRRSGVMLPADRWVRQRSPPTRGGFLSG